MHPDHTDDPRATLREETTHDFPHARAVFHNNSTSQSQRLTSPPVPQQRHQSLRQGFPLPVRHSAKSKRPAIPAARRPVVGVHFSAVDDAHSERAVLLCHSLSDDRPADYATSAIGGFFPRTRRNSTSAGDAARRKWCSQPFSRQILRPPLFQSCSCSAKSSFCAGPMGVLSRKVKSRSRAPTLLRGVSKWSSIPRLPNQLQHWNHRFPKPHPCNWKSALNSDWN